MQCRDFRDIADSYLGDELLVETNHEVFRHLESCANCRRELEARRTVRARLRSAFKQAEELRPREEFITNLNAHLRSTALGEAESPFLNRRMWLAIAACLVVAVAVGLFGSRFWGAARTTSTNIARSENSNPDRAGNPSSQSHDEAGVRTLFADLTHDAAGDHRDCAVDYRLAETPISLEEAGQKYDRAYISLTEAVMSQQTPALTGDVEFVEAHSCVFNGRRFGHVVLKQRGRLVSVLVTDIEYSEARAARLDQTGAKQQVIACAQLDGYQVSCFETARHAVFVVSELSEADNLNLARAVAPSVFEHITRAEARA